MKKARFLFISGFLFLAMGLVCCFICLTTVDKQYKEMLSDALSRNMELAIKCDTLYQNYAVVKADLGAAKANYDAYKLLYNSANKELAMYEFVYGDVCKGDVRQKMEELGLEEDDMWEYDLEFLFCQTNTVPTPSKSITPSPTSSTKISPTPTPQPKPICSESPIDYATPIKEPVCPCGHCCYPDD